MKTTRMISYVTQPSLKGSALTYAQLTPQLLKPAVSKALNALLAPIQTAYQESKEWQEITLKAYPPEDKKKKEKKVKNKGSRYPGGAKGADGESAPTEEKTAPAPSQ